MSDSESRTIDPESLDKLDAAIREYAGKGDYVTEWVLVAAASPGDDPNAVAYHFGESSRPPHVLLGLFHAGTRRMEKFMDGGTEDA
jgi:hypothetical protein